GYGKAEAMLFHKHPDRFNSLGNARWAGRIYGGIRSRLPSSQAFIYFGPFGSGLFQRVYQAPTSWLADFPLALEWNILTLLLLLGGFLSPLFAILGLVSGSASAWCAVQRAISADVPVKHSQRLGRMLVGVLSYIQPLARGWARFRRVLADDLQRHRPSGWTHTLRAMVRHPWRRRTVFSYWTDAGVEKEALLQPVLHQLREAGYPTLTDSGWNPWDLAIDAHLWARIPIEVVVENHGGSKRLTRFRLSWKLEAFSKGLLWACGVLLGFGLLYGHLWMVEIAAAAALTCLGFVAHKSTAIMREVGEMIQSLAAELKLLPLNGKHENS
ncbi:MAG: hypothetical protein ACREOH_22035, partial [Candidatus Entotheonellia bacterium]